MYNGNRFALNLFSGLFGQLPVVGTPLLIIFSISLWIISIAGIIREASHIVYRHIDLLESFLYSEVLLSLVLVSAQDIEQSLFWRSGMLPYFLPQVGILLIIWIVLRTTRRRERLWLSYSIIFILGLLFSGFSETGTFLLLGMWGIGLFVSLIRTRTGEQRFRLLLVNFGLLLISALVGFTLLYFSPSTALRRVNMPEPLPANTFISLLLSNLKVFFWQAVMRRALYLLLPIAFGLFLGFWVRKAAGNPHGDMLKFWKIIAVGACILASGLVLIALVFLPSTYIFADYPPDRALILAQFVIIFTGTSGGIWLAVVIQRLISSLNMKSQTKGVINSVLSIVLTIFLLVAPVMQIRTALRDLPKYAKWSRLWDERNQILVIAGRENKEQVHVIQLDHIINDVGELSPDPDYWYNNCAEWYYGIDSIIADQPGW